MKASELIEKLKELQETHGDLVVATDDGYDVANVCYEEAESFFMIEVVFMIEADN